MPEGRNVLGEKLDTCSIRPMTGVYRTGCCETGAADVGAHVVCVEVTKEFLAFSKTRGNDLSTPVPEKGFPGLKPGDRSCLCATRGRRRSMPAWRRASCCARRMRKRSTTCRSRISRDTRSISPDPTSQRSRTPARRVITVLTHGRGWAPAPPAQTGTVHPHETGRRPSGLRPARWGISARLRVSAPPIPAHPIACCSDWLLASASRSYRARRSKRSRLAMDRPSVPKPRNGSSSPPG
jgi:uncharacterized protein (DUF2237 family)